MWFIDTNVVVHWILGDGGILDLIKQKFHLNQDFVEIYKNRYEDSRLFVNVILEKKSMNKKDEFYISYFAINEIFSAVRDELRSIIMFRKGIPISRWRDSRNNPDINKEDYESIYQGVLKSYDKLFGSGDILLIEEQTPEDNESYFDIYSSLLFLIKQMKTQDATLLTTAILNEADYFITKDEALIKSAKKKVEEEYNLTLSKPKNALQLLNHNGVGKK